MKGYNSPWKQLLLSAIESFQKWKIACLLRIFKEGVCLFVSGFSSCRGFEENSDRIQINTDFRTRKVCLLLRFPPTLM
uniref:Uncharacterized protein n=1 Tax=Salix viminalis TaxID=40686 RepID=A0A6N2KZ20_SALVM